MPRPVEALPCGSISMTRVGSPTAASAVPRLIAVVVLPTPPFWLATTSTLGRLTSGMAGGMGKLPDLQDRAGRIGQALVLEDFHFPGIAGLRQFSPYILSLEEQAPGARPKEFLCIEEQPIERRAGPRGHDVEDPGRGRLHALVADDGVEA